MADAFPSLAAVFSAPKGGNQSMQYMTKTVRSEKRKFRKLDSATSAALLDNWGMNFKPTDTTAAATELASFDATHHDDDEALALALSASLASAVTPPTPDHLAAAAAASELELWEHTIPRFERELNHDLPEDGDWPRTFDILAMKMGFRHVQGGAPYVRRSLRVSKFVAASLRTKRNDAPDTATTSPKPAKAAAPVSARAAPTARRVASQPCPHAAAAAAKRVSSTRAPGCSAAMRVTSKHGTTNLRHDPFRYYAALQRMIRTRDEVEQARAESKGAQYIPAVPDTVSRFLRVDDRYSYAFPTPTVHPAAGEDEPLPNAHLKRDFFRNLHEEGSNRLRFVFVPANVDPKFRFNGIARPISSYEPESPFYNAFIKNRLGFARLQDACEHDYAGTIYLCAVVSNKRSPLTASFPLVSGRTIPLTAYSFTRGPIRWPGWGREELAPLNHFVSHCRDPWLAKYGLGPGRLRESFPAAPAKMDVVGFFRHGIKSGARKINCALLDRRRAAGRASRTVGFTLAA